MSSKATPGPWIVAPHTSGESPVYVVSEYEERLSGEMAANWIAACGLLDGTDYPDDCYEENLANARLMAAAPALRDAAIAEERATKHRDDCAYCDMGDSTCGVYSNLRRDAEIARRAALAACEPEESSR